MDKNKKKELLKKYAEEQRNAFANSLPFSIILFKELFDYLDEKIGEDSCDNTLKHTIRFLKDNNLPVDTSLDWMKENGGYCDCEALGNLEGKISEV